MPNISQGCVATSDMFKNIASILNADFYIKSTDESKCKGNVTAIGNIWRNYADKSMKWRLLNRICKWRVFSVIL